jgi:F-type H+-transporting ATPase subunit epsilon
MAEAAGTLDVVVVSPARPVFEGTASYVDVPAVDGQLGILPGHAPIVAALGSGILRIGQAGGGGTRFAVRGGFLKAGGTKVTVLVDSAVTKADADSAEAQRGLDETLEALRHPRTDGEFAALLEQRAWFESRIKLAGS